MEVYSRQPLAKGKGVHRELESEGSRRQKSCPEGHESHIGISFGIRLQNKSKSKDYTDKGV